MSYDIKYIAEQSDFKNKAFFAKLLMGDPHLALMLFLIPKKGFKMLIWFFRHTNGTY